MNDIYKSILSIIRYYLIKDNSVLLSDDLAELLKISNKLSVSSFVSYVLNELGYKDVDKSLLASFRNDKLQVLVINEINTLFDNNSIEYMYIKGTSISKYYKDPYLRAGSDIDVVVKDKDYKKTYKLLIDNGYKQEMKVDDEAHLISPSGILIDLHNSFIETSNILNNYLITKFNINHELNIEDSYMLTIAHSVKHFKRGVIDLRLFTDLFFLKDKINDYSNINKMLNELGLLEYNNIILRYLDLILGKIDYDDTLRLLENYIVQMTNDNNVFKNHIIGKLATDGLNNVSVPKYILSRIFIPSKRMYEHFPYLNNHKFLLPLFYLIRPFYMITRIKPTKLNELKDELDTVNSLNRIELNNTLDLYKKIGLYNHIDI